MVSGSPSEAGHRCATRARLVVRFATRLAGPLVAVALVVVRLATRLAGARLTAFFTPTVFFAVVRLATRFAGARLTAFFTPTVFFAVVRLATRFAGARLTAFFTPTVFFAVVRLATRLRRGALDGLLGGWCRLLGDLANGRGGLAGRDPFRGPFRWCSLLYGNRHRFLLGSALRRHEGSGQWLAERRCEAECARDSLG